MAEARHPERRRDLDVVNRPGEHLLYDPEDGTLHQLNATSMAIWETCDGNTSPVEIAEAVAQLSGLPVLDARAIVDSAVDDLAERGLLR